MEYVACSSPRSGEDYSEDAHVVIESGGTFLAAVIDTHHREVYTHEQASAVAKATAEAFAQGAQVPRDRLLSALERADQFLLRHHPDFGAVVTAVEVRGTQMTVAQLGDSRLYQSNWNQTGYEVLTPTHTAQNPQELARMEPLLLSGTFQVRVDVHDGHVIHRLYARRWWRFWHPSGLVPTRTIGNALFRPAVSAQPQMLTIDLAQTPARTLFVLCSDGAQAVVERMYQHLRVRARLVKMEDVQTFIEQEFLFEHDDDATIVCFRVT